MKKIFLPAIITCIITLSSFASANTVSDEAQIGQQIGNLYVASMNNDEKYLVDESNEIMGGPFTNIGDYNGYAYAQKSDGTNVMFDLDGSILAYAGADDSIFPPKNGLYAIARNLPFGEDYSLCSAFELYDYGTKEKLCTLDKVFYYYLEQQSDRMAIENNEGKYAFINKYGQLLTDYIYDEVKQRFNPDYNPYPKSYAIVVQNGEEKYIDASFNEINLNDYNGEPFITNYTAIPQSDSISDLSDTYYIVENGERTALYNEKTDEYVIPFQTEYIFISINDGLIKVKQNNSSTRQFGALDLNNNIVIPAEYKSLQYLGNNLYKFIAANDDENNTYSTKYGIIKDGIKVFTYDKEVFSVLDDGIILLQYPDPNESFEYAHNYRDYIYEVVNFAGHNLTGDVYTRVDYADGILYTSKSPHGMETPDTPIEINKNFAVINLNGKYLNFDGIIIDDRTLVPMREIIEGLGGTVEWNGNDKTVHAVIDGTSINLAIDSNIMTIDGKEQEIDVPAQIINDKTMLPVRAVSEAVNAEVDWDEDIRCVYINK